MMKGGGFSWCFRSRPLGLVSRSGGPPWSMLSRVLYCRPPRTSRSSPWSVSPRPPPAKRIPMHRTVRITLAGWPPGFIVHSYPVGGTLVFSACTRDGVLSTVRWVIEMRMIADGMPTRLARRGGGGGLEAVTDQKTGGRSLAFS